MSSKYETTTKETEDGLLLEYKLIDNIEEYVDVDIYVTLPSWEQYLVRVYKEVGEDDIPEPYYRYAKGPSFDFGDDVRPPKRVKDAVSSVLSDIHDLLRCEEARRASK